MTEQRTSPYTKTEDRLDAWCNAYGWGIDLNFMTGKCRLCPGGVGRWKSFSTFDAALAYIEVYARTFSYKLP